MSEESRIKWRHFLSGDNDAYRWLYKTYIQVLFSYGRRFTSDTEIIKDCIQEVFTTIYKSRNKLSTPDNIKLYLLVSLKNKLRRTLATPPKNLHQSDYEASTKDLLFTLEKTVEDEYIENEEHLLQKKKVDEIFAILTPRQKEIIYYRYIQELELKEICELMNINYQSAKNLIQRSLDKIRNNYSGSLDTFLLFLVLSNGISK